MSRQSAPPPAQNSGCLIVAGTVFVLLILTMVFAIAVANGN